MGVTFKIAKKGTRFHPQPKLENADEDNVAGCSKDSSQVTGNNDSTSISARRPEVNALCGTGDVTEMPDCEVSFVLNLFPDSYSVSKPSGNDSVNQDSQKGSRPYDKTSEILASAIECGQLPADMLSDFPLKYVDGAVICEVRDHRKCTPAVGTTMPSSSDRPIVQKVRLRMSLANVVKDMPMISDDTWTYGDMMEVESRILKALQPKLCLDPTPMLGRLSTSRVTNKLDLDISSLRRKRLKQTQDVINASNCALNGQKGYIDGVAESSIARLGEYGLTSLIPQNAHANMPIQNISPITSMMTTRINSVATDPSIPLLPLTTQQSQQHHMGMTNQSLVMQETNISGPLMNVPGASAMNQETMYSYANNIVNVNGKREYQDGSHNSQNNLPKRVRGMVANAEQQQTGPHMDNFQGSDIQRKNSRGGMRYPISGGAQKYPQQAYEDVLALNASGQPGLRLVTAKEEPIEMERFDKQEPNQIKNEMQQRLPPQHAFMRPNLSQTPWNNLGSPHHEISTRKDDQSQKRKSAQSPRISASGFPQSPLSSKSGEFSSGSVGHQFGPVVTSSLAVSQKDKSAVNSKPTASGVATSSDSLQRSSHIVSKRRPSSQPKNSAISGVGSLGSVGNMSVLSHSSSSPQVGSTPLIDPQLLDRFSKIDALSNRFKLSCKANTKGVENYHVRNSAKFSTEHLSAFLFNDINIEFPRDEMCTMPLSRSLIGGSLNVNKIRVLNFIQQEPILQGDGFSSGVTRTRTKMLMSEKSNDCTIALHYGDIDDNDFLAAEEYLLTLPNAHSADILAKQLCKLMIQDGYHVEDHLQVKPLNRTNHPLSNQPNTNPGTPIGSQLVDIQQHHNTDPVSSQLMSEAPKPSNSGNNTARMLPPPSGNTPQPYQSMSQGLVLPSSIQLSSRPQQQQQQTDNNGPSTQHPSIQHRSSSLMLPGNAMSQMNANSQLGNMSYNKPSSIQLQMMQQQQQQQQQSPQLQRKMMMGLGPAAANMSGLGNIMGQRGGMGVGVGMGPTAMSSQMGQISGMGGTNVGQNINNALRSGQLTTTQAQIMTKIRMAQNRASMLAASGSHQAAGIGARQMQQHPGSMSTSTGIQMLGQSSNRGNMNPIQNRSAMGPPKMMTAMNMNMNMNMNLNNMNMYMNSQQQQQLQHQQHLQLQQMQQQQQQLQQFQQQQQEANASSIQDVVTTSSPQVVVGDSPSTMNMQQLNQVSQPQMLQTGSQQQMPQAGSQQQMLQAGSQQQMLQTSSQQQMLQTGSQQQMLQASSQQQMLQAGSQQQMLQAGSQQQMLQAGSQQQMLQAGSQQQILQSGSQQQMLQAGSQQQMLQTGSQQQMQPAGSQQQMQPAGSQQQMQPTSSQQQMQPAGSQQQMNQKTPMSPQISSGSMHPLTTESPPLNSSNHTSSVELQGAANRTNSTNNG